MRQMLEECLVLVLVMSPNLFAPSAPAFARGCQTRCACATRETKNGIWLGWHSRSHQNRETCLLKVFIAGQNFLNTVIFHHNHAHAIRQVVAFVLPIFKTF